MTEKAVLENVTCKAFESQDMQRASIFKAVSKTFFAREIDRVNIL